MDALGQRLEQDRESIDEMRRRADQLEAQANKLRQDADEMERLLELARFSHG